jgi:hypothetical protein
MSNDAIISDRDPIPLERVTLDFEDGLGASDKRSLSIELSDNFELDLSSLAPNAMLIEHFVSTIKDILDKAQEAKGVEDSKRIILVDDYSGDRLGNLLRNRKAVITYRVMSRKPANMSADDRKFKSRLHRPQRVYQDPSKFDRAIEVKVRYIMHNIELAVWSPNATAANQVALWLERTLVMETWRVKRQGAVSFEWTGRGMDTATSVAGQKLETRPLNFHVKLAELITSSHPKIRSIRLRSGLYLLGLED